ncbi:hypothetical protein CR513_51071, partial [Mucuna pruriens]
MVVDRKVPLAFTLGKYSDEILCHVVLMEATHILLGRHSQFDRKVTHYRVTNSFFCTNGTKDDPQTFISKRDQLKLKIKKEKNKKKKRKSKKLREKKKRKTRVGMKNRVRRKKVKEKRKVREKSKTNVKKRGDKIERMKGTLCLEIRGIRRVVLMRKSPILLTLYDFHLCCKPLLFVGLRQVMKEFRRSIHAKEASKCHIPRAFVPPKDAFAFVPRNHIYEINRMLCVQVNEFAHIELELEAYGQSGNIETMSGPYCDKQLGNSLSLKEHDLIRMYETSLHNCKPHLHVKRHDRILCRQEQKFHQMATCILNYKSGIHDEVEYCLFEMPKSFIYGSYNKGIKLEVPLVEEKTSLLQFEV